jgi:hypothetical protein
MSLSLNYPTISPSLLLDFANSGRLDPQVTFTRSSTATFFDATGTLQSAAIDAPRFDYNPSTLAARGLLIEEQRTNSIRNNTMVGAVAGTPGTLPTNWGVGGSGLGTLTQEVVGTGTTSGITWIDLKFSGTTSTTDFNLAFEATTQIAALSGQSWSESAYLAIVGGATTNITNIRLQLEGRNSGGSTVESFLSAGVQGSLTSTLQRFPLTATLANANTAFSRPTLRFDFSSGVAIDITLRIGLPQLEQGAFATSVIPTTTTALTRAADVANVNTLSPWFNSASGTLYGEFAVAGYVPSGAFPSMAALSDNTSSNRVNIANTNIGANLFTYGEITTGGVAQAGFYGASGSGFGVGTVRKAAIAYAANDFAFTTQGLTAQTDTSGTVPIVDRLYLGIASTGSTQFLNGYLRRIVYYPRRLSNAELQAITV